MKTIYTLKIEYFFLIQKGFFSRNIFRLIFITVAFILLIKCLDNKRYAVHNNNRLVKTKSMYNNNYIIYIFNNNIIK